MKFGLLGPMLVHDGDQGIAIPAARQRVLLAAMLVRAGRVVAAGELAELVWDGMPPPGSAATLRSYVKRLRQVLGPRAGASDSAGMKRRNSPLHPRTQKRKLRDPFEVSVPACYGARELHPGISPLSRYGDHVGP